MELTAKQIAKFLKGDILGNPFVIVNKISEIENGEKYSITFLSNPKYNKYIYKTFSSIIIVNKNFIPKKNINSTLIKVKDPYLSFTKILNIYENEIKQTKFGIEKPIFINKNSKLGKNIYIGAFSYISSNVTICDNVKIYPNVFIGNNVKINNNTIIYSGVSLYDNTIIGENCIIHSGTTIGSDGFGFVNNIKNKKYKKIPQIGNVIIKNFVEIGSSCTIDKATIGSTVLNNGVKLDNQVQVAHNVIIGDNTIIAAQTGIAGSTKIGRNTMIGGQVGIIGHLKIGDNVKIAAQSGIIKDVPDNSIVQGSPSLPSIEYKKSYIHFKNLSDLVKRFNKLENKYEK